MGVGVGGGGGGGGGWGGVGVGVGVGGVGVGVGGVGVGENITSSPSNVEFGSIIVQDHAISIWNYTITELSYVALSVSRYLGFQWFYSMLTDMDSVTCVALLCIQTYELYGMMGFYGTFYKIYIWFW